MKRNRFTVEQIVNGQVKGGHVVEGKWSLFLLSRHALFEPVAFSVHGQDVSMMGQAI
jgi:hypothetical protein